MANGSRPSCWPPLKVRLRASPERRGAGSRQQSYNNSRNENDLNQWVETANGGVLASATVPWVAAEGNHGYEIALEWIESAKENVTAAGWATLSSLVVIKKDDDLDLAGFKKLLQRVQATIHQQPNNVRLTMNGFEIAVRGARCALDAPLDRVSFGASVEVALAVDDVYAAELTHSGSQRPVRLTCQNCQPSRRLGSQPSTSRSIIGTQHTG